MRGITRAQHPFGRGERGVWVNRLRTSLSREEAPTRGAPLSFPQQDQASNTGGLEPLEGTPLLLSAMPHDNNPASSDRTNLRYHITNKHTTPEPLGRICTPPWCSPLCFFRKTPRLPRLRMPRLGLCRPAQQQHWSCVRLSLLYRGVLISRFPSFHNPRGGVRK